MMIEFLHWLWSPKPGVWYILVGFVIGMIFRTVFGFIRSTIRFLKEGEKNI